MSSMDRHSTHPVSRSTRGGLALWGLLVTLLVACVLGLTAMLALGFRTQPVAQPMAEPLLPARERWIQLAGAREAHARQLLSAWEEFHGACAPGEPWVEEARDREGGRLLTELEAEAVSPEDRLLLARFQERAQGRALLGNCHQNPHFKGLRISELRYVRDEESGERAAPAFLELQGPPGFSVSGMKVRIFRGHEPVREHVLPAGTRIASDGYLLISNVDSVLARDRSTQVAVDVRVAYDGGDWLPTASGSGVTLVMDDPHEPGDLPEVVDSVHYNPSGASPRESWWESPSPVTTGVGEELPAPGLPYPVNADPVWGLSRVGRVDLDANHEDFLVASVTPGGANEELWYDDGTRLPGALRPRLQEVMPNTNGFKDENSFVESWALAGQRWRAGPGTYELIAMNGGGTGSHGGQRNFVELAGSVPEGGFFVVADSPRLPEAFGGLVPHQEVHCADLHQPSLRCDGVGASEWDWLGNNQSAGVMLVYWIDAKRRIIVDSLRWSPDLPEMVNAFRQGEGLAPEEPSSPATSFSRFGVDTHFNRADFKHADPSPGRANAEPLVSGGLQSRYGASFPFVGVAPPEANGRVVLFDQTKRQKAGSTGHWIITENGDYTDWAWQLYHAGYEVRATGTGNTKTVETLSERELRGVHVLVIPEPQAPYSEEEKSVLRSYLHGGGSLFFIANHRGSDRDGDGWDSGRIWNENLDLDALTGVALADAECFSENVVGRATQAASAHPVLQDVMTPSCASGSPGCTLTDSVLFRPPGVGIFSGAFLAWAEPAPEGITQRLPLIEGVRPTIGRAPHRLDGYGGAVPLERYAMAIQTSWGPGAGARIVLLGDSAVLNDGGSADYATYAASLAFNAYGTAFRNALFGMNVIHWLAGQPSAAGSALPPSLVPAPQEAGEPRAIAGASPSVSGGGVR
ncbi:GldG family protein [Archangium gephyra]|uniref:hypothetical protein n=1 Tax=Archangium gephyra TaxID=48 RepID=UPI0035D4972E